MSALLVLCGYAAVIAAGGWLGAAAVAAHVLALVIGAAAR